MKFAPALLHPCLEVELTSRARVDGHFRLVVSRADGSVRRDIAFDNLVLDAGVNRLGTDNAITFCAIGAGTATPVANQTTLQAQSQSTSTTLTGSATDSGGVTPYWTGYTFVFRFPIGSLGGNYSEVGVGWSSTLMYSRALILDAGGSPTSITVGAGEQLDVYYTRRIYPPLSDAVTTANISGVSTTVTCRAMNAGSTSAWGAQNFPSALSSSSYQAYSGSIGSITGSPSGDTGSAPSSVSLLAYSNNSLTRGLQVNYAFGEGNAPGGISSTAVPFSMMAYQFGFSPPIAKTSSFTLALTYAVSWARRP